MKLNKYSWLAALPLLFTACQDDMLVEKHSQQGIYTLTATMDGGTDSRAQIVLNGTSTTKESFHWNEGDKFTLFQNTDINNDWSTSTWITHEFSIDENYDDSKPASSVDFSTTDSSNMLLQGDKFVAIYPNLNVRDDAMNVVYMEHDQELEDNSENSWKEYFKKNMFMLSEEGIIEGNSVSTNVKFQHLCGLIRITYTNDTGVDQNVKRIFMDGQWTQFREYFINDVDRLTNYNYEFAPDEYGLTFTGEEGAVVPANESVDFYLLFFPVEAQMMQRISVVDMDDNVRTTPSYRDMKGSFPFVFESGKCYWMKITDNGDELLWTKFIQDSGNNDNVTNEAIEVSTFSELKQALATQAGPIYLTADIELTSPLVVEYAKPIYMNGKTISLSEDFEWGDADAAITSKSNLSIFGEGLIIGLDTDETIEKAFLKSENELYLEGVTIKPLSFATAIHVVDARCFVNPGSYISAARRYAINMEADQSCDVDIYKSEVYGDIRFALNAETYTESNYCRFGVGPSSKVYGDLLIEGTYADTATGYHLQVETTAKTEGENWDDSRITSVTANN